MRDAHLPEIQRRGDREPVVLRVDRPSCAQIVEVDRRTDPYPSHTSKPAGVHRRHLEIPVCLPRGITKRCACFRSIRRAERPTNAAEAIAKLAWHAVLGATGCSPAMKSLAIPAARAEEIPSTFAAARSDVNTPQITEVLLTLISGTTRDANSVAFRLGQPSGWSISSSDPRLESRSSAGTLLP